MPMFNQDDLLFQAEDGIRDWSVTGVQTCALLFQAEDGIRDWSVTGVQTCALPISPAFRVLAGLAHRAGLAGERMPGVEMVGFPVHAVRFLPGLLASGQIGRASCRERV